MKTEILLALRGGTSFVSDALGAGRDALRRSAGDRGLEVAAPAHGAPERRAFDLLVAAPTGAVELAETAGESGPMGVARWRVWARHALRNGALVYRLSLGGEVLAEIVPVRADAPDLSDELRMPASAVRVQLSRFALLHRIDEALVLESPAATMRARLGPAAVLLVAGFASPRAVSPVDGMDADAAAHLTAVLLAAGLLVEVDAHGASGEDDDVVLSQWELPDLMLHARSRIFDPDRPRGGTFHLADTRPAPPALAFPVGDPAIPLPLPDLDRLIATDPPLARVMEQRRSRRGLGPIDAAQLGEFLYRTVRVRRSIAATDDPRTYPVTLRPHPAGGGMHELTTYLAIGECAGIDPGLYRYDPVGHGLDLVAPSGVKIDRLLRDAGAATASETNPPLLIILAADFARLSWKYQGIAYATTLKNVGVIYQTMQLAATAMGLGSCPVGGGDSELFSLAAGARGIEHTSVGEFVLGS